jgi:hypothetical protein
VPDTFIKIASVTVGSGGASSIDFTSIPNTYTDLCIKINARMTTAATGEYIQVSFNSVTTNLTSKLLLGYTTAATSYDESTIIPAGLFSGSTTTASTFGSGEVYIPNYTASVNKSVSVDAVSENNSGATNAAYQLLIAGLWSSTAAITAIALTAKTGLIAQYSTATLYGISKS